MHPLLESGDESIYTLRTKAPGPAGLLPFTSEQLKTQPSGHLFGWTQNVGMGWDADKVGGGDYVILSIPAVHADENIVEHEFA